MFAVIYRWKLKPGHEESFERGWERGTKRIAAELGGKGSRLHRGEPGVYVAYAQWPDEATWRRAMEGGMAHSDEEARRLYREAFEEHDFEVLFAGEVARDLLHLANDSNDGG